MVIKVYTTKTCPNCKKVEQFLTSEGEEYKEVDITTAEALTELRMNGIFTLCTPVVQIDSLFLTYEDLFDGEGMKKDQLKDLIKTEVRHEKGV